jgi:hypothetical protein
MVTIAFTENEPARAVNVAETAPAATVMDAGVVNTAELSEIATAVPPAAAAWEIVTVQVVLVFGDRLLAAHCTLETARPADNDNDAL